MAARWYNQPAHRLACLALVVCAVLNAASPARAQVGDLPRTMPVAVPYATAPEPPHEDLWTDPRVVAPVMPLDLPPIVTAQYERPLSPQSGYAAAWVNHQEPIPKPEQPPEPLPGDAALSPVPFDPAWPTPSCLDCGGCGTCGTCEACEPCVARTRFGRFACGIYQAICCPDPCYEPAWTGLKNASFFADFARPTTLTRFRWDAAFDVVYPDRAEFLWPQVGSVGPAVAPNTMRLHELSQYTEIASGGFSTFFDTPYRSFDTDGGAFHGAGFGDMSIGTKSVLFDCELLTLTFQFKTTVPVGVGRNGLGTQHVSLEPSLLMGMSLAPDTYLQAQIAEWIPISGDVAHAGAILHYHASLNHVLFRWQPSVPIVGTLEANGWSFQHGQYTDPVRGVLSATGETYVSAGPGLRVVVCDKLDFGVGGAIAVTDGHWGEQTMRTEMRWRY